MARGKHDAKRQKQQENYYANKTESFGSATDTQGPFSTHIWSAELNPSIESFFLPYDDKRNGYWVKENEFITEREIILARERELNLAYEKGRDKAEEELKNHRYHWIVEARMLDANSGFNEIGEIAKLYEFINNPQIQLEIELEVLTKSMTYLLGDNSGYAHASCDWASLLSNVALINPVDLESPGYAREYKFTGDPQPYIDRISEIEDELFLWNELKR